MDTLAEWFAGLGSLTPLLDWSGLPLDLASLAVLAAGVGWASGLRLYALVFVLGALGRWGGVHLPGGLEVLTNPWVLGLSGLMLFTEFFADKLPWLDSLWDSLHTFIRIPAGAALAAGVMGDQGAGLQLAGALLGGSLAASTHFAKAGARAALNTSPEPVSNLLASFGEDGIFIGGLWLMFNHPLWFAFGLVVFVLCAIVLIVLLWRFLKRIFRPRPRPTAV
ncbi:DUF4126 domain-containing protein [Thauera sp. SDU_THAU2]|uniref:DUF4126 domain-containing protein n=1 Tax=Thauera sp. SDU_THAU2 TaxID=3136633 RepID=UPI00311D8BF1